MKGGGFESFMSSRCIGIETSNSCWLTNVFGNRDVQQQNKTSPVAPQISWLEIIKEKALQEEREFLESKILKAQ